MRVNELARKLKLEQVTSAGDDKEITGVYVCDLLSRVMSSCQEGDAWITVQTHMNILAVAELNGAACIIVPENITVNSDTVEKAWDRGISILSSGLNAYELCWKLHEILS